jgi:hypothetical protein
MPHRPVAVALGILLFIFAARATACRGATIDVASRWNATNLHLIVTGLAEGDTIICTVNETLAWHDCSHLMSALINGYADTSGVVDLNIQPKTGQQFKEGNGVHVWERDPDALDGVWRGKEATCGLFVSRGYIMTFRDCPGCPSPVPSLTEYGLIGLAAILVLSGVWIFWRRRALA